MSRHYLTWVLLPGSVAFLSTAVSTMLLASEAVSFYGIRASLHSLMVTTVVLNGASLLCISHHVIQVIQLHGHTRGQAHARTGLLACSALLSSIALVISVVSIVMVGSERKEATSTPSQAAFSNWSVQMSAHIAVWALSVISQIALYLSPWWNRRIPCVQEISVSGPRDSGLFQPQNAIPAYCSPTASKHLQKHPLYFEQCDIRSPQPQHYSVAPSACFGSWDTSSVSPQFRAMVIGTAAQNAGPGPSISPSSLPKEVQNGRSLLTIHEDQNEDQLAGQIKTEKQVLWSQSSKDVHPAFRSKNASLSPPATTAIGP
jgi:hypothetical protein